jgi:predicted exporter
MHALLQQAGSWQETKGPMQDLLMIELLELIAQLVPSSWRSLVPMAIGIGCGLAIYFLSGQDPAGAAMAFAAGLLGIVVGFLWEFFHRRHS